MKTPNTEARNPDCRATNGRLHSLVRRLRAETVLGCPTICEEEWKLIEAIILDEMNLPSEPLDVRAICEHRDKLLADLEEMREALRAMVAAKGRYNTQKAMEHLIGLLPENHVSNDQR